MDIPLPSGRRVSLDDFNTVASPDPEAPESQRVFTDAYEFIDEQEEPPTPLWGNERLSLLPAGALAILAGRPGVGKTSFVLDLACHLAAGVAYPPRSEVASSDTPSPWPIPRPLRVAVIENEGPKEMFRQKLRAKLEGFPHDIRNGDGSLLIQTWRWGDFSFRNGYHEKLRAELEWEAIDVVIGDPLTMLGLEGVGSPAETRDFVQLLQPLGLHHDRSFLFLHHFRERVERSEDELARISGAWGGHLDTMLTLAAGHHADYARLAFPKIRWGTEMAPGALTLGRVWNTASFEMLGKDGDAGPIDHMLAGKLEEARESGSGRQGWLSSRQLAEAAETPRGAVQKALEGNPGLFLAITGEDAKALGARRDAVLWGLKRWRAGADIDWQASDPDGDIPF